ncbi:uncharacterized protein LOC117780407 [Drosophila innubila]|uniref:uncharacterized protein LOC117780407 n=1 Tax=Drosophila innubila TaxID=198719 RepID=UPI00148BFD39|nr:uncharacterized protein LOC117780407 [Drosophila innubila]
MLNESKGIDVGTATEDCSDLDVSSEDDSDDVLAEDTSMQPGGSRTLDNRLNPDAPDFVPGVTTRLLAVKIVDELSSYPRWSNASSDIASYGPRYDSIWRESCPRTQLQVQNESAIEPVMQQLPNVIEIVGDVEPSLNQRSKDQSDPAIGESASTGRCCASCALM